jgi:hypothetical protein
VAKDGRCSLHLLVTTHHVTLRSPVDLRVVPAVAGSGISHKLVQAAAEVGGIGIGTGDGYTSTAL